MDFFSVEGIERETEATTEAKSNEERPWSRVRFVLFSLREFDHRAIYFSSYLLQSRESYIYFLISFLIFSYCMLRNVGILYRNYLMKDIRPIT